MKPTERHWHRLLVIIEITFLKITYLFLTHLICLSAVIFSRVSLSGSTKKAIVNKYRVQDSKQKDCLNTVQRMCWEKHTEWILICNVCWEWEKNAFQKKLTFDYLKHSLCLYWQKICLSYVFLQEREEYSMFLNNC